MDKGPKKKKTKKKKLKGKTPIEPEMSSYERRMRKEGCWEACCALGFIDGDELSRGAP